jgi:signal transduction histidine kinase/DNA-binding response OmpR family regulator
MVKDQQLYVLLVEDNEDDATLLLRMLEKHGFDLHSQVVSNRESLREALAEGCWQIIISDYSLPGFDAIEALEIIRKHDSDIPVIVVSGTIGEEIAVNILKKGANDYLLKDKLIRLGPSVERELRDLEEKVRTRHQLAEQAALLDKATDAISVRTLDHQIQYMNVSARRLYHGDDEDAAPPALLQVVKRADGLELKESIRELLSRGEWSGELLLSRKEHPDMVLESRWTLVLDEKQMPASILAIETDISAKKQLERQFIRMQRMESIGTLASGIAHDLNNVLTPILMAMDVLKMRNSDTRCLSLIETVEISAQRGAEMVRQVLSFARGVEGGPHREVPLQKLLHDLRIMAKETFPKNLVTDFVIEEDLPSVLGDPTQLHQVLLNLCVNARDAMTEGGILQVVAKSMDLDATYLSQFDDAKEGTYLLLEVSDTGSGIPKKDWPLIFEPFFSTKEAGRGTGLGLSTVQSIVKAHSGFVSFRSEMGKGTTFCVYLPAYSVEHLAAEKAKDLLCIRTDGRCVLLVDDEVSVLAITRQTLEAYGYNVLTATDGAEAIAVFVSNQDAIELVITDIVMPLMDGVAVVESISKISPDIQFIAVSGVGASSMERNLKRLGVEIILHKPYTSAILLKAVQKLLKPVH